MPVSVRITSPSGAISLTMPAVVVVVVSVVVVPGTVWTVVVLPGAVCAGAGEPAKRVAVMKRGKVTLEMSMEWFFVVGLFGGRRKTRSVV